MSELFALDHAATTMPWLESPFTASLLAAATHLSPLAREQAEAFSRDGYLLLDSGVDGAVFDQVVSGLADAYRPGRGDVASSEHRIQDAWNLGDAPTAQAVRQIAAAPAIVDVLRMLYRREPVPFQTLNFPHGTEQATHSDTVHFHCIPERFMCGVWVALEDIRAEAGPLHYYPGSHRLPIYTLQDLGLAASARRTRDGKPELYGDSYARYERFVAAVAQSSGLPRRQLTIRRGQALVWAANLLHGGDPIDDHALSRHSQVTHYYFAGNYNYTPMQTDFALGRIAQRNIVDVTSGAAHPNEYLGHALCGGPDGGPPSLGATTRRFPLASAAAHRILCWPDYRSDAQLAHLAEAGGRPLMGRDDACLCLRHDAERDPPLPDVVQRLERVFEATLGQSPPVQILIVDDPADKGDWAQLGSQATCVARLGQECRDRSDFLHAMRVPVLPLAAAVETPASYHQKQI